MATIPLSKVHSAPQQRFALFNLGFRPFFLFGSVFAVVVMLLWLLIYQGTIMLPLAQMEAWHWHAHEMIFGYAMAIVTGFLLTASRNWTGHQTLNGMLLFGLLLFWVMARVVMAVNGWLSLSWVAGVNLLFLMMATIAIAHPIVKARQWTQMAVVSKVALIVIADLLFFLGVDGYLEHGVEWGLYNGFYLIIALLLLMLRRVGPFFIERGCEGTFTPINRRWIDISSIILVLLFWIVDGFSLHTGLSAALAATLAVIHTIRLYGWYHPKIWNVPLLWVLLIGYIAVITGFVLHAVIPFTTVSRTLATHALAVGGVGLITLGMMARVSLGHTGRNVAEPPKSITVVFILILLAMVLRVLMPLLFAEYYQTWITLSQISWIAAFVWFVWLYGAMLWQPRIDGVLG